MRFAEFFAGIGLVRMGLERSGWECAFANDNDPQKWELYERRFPGARRHFVLGDVRDVAPSRVGAVDLATASFPCTDLSLAGPRVGLGGKHSSALWPFLEILSKLGSSKPPVVMLENVPAFLTSRGGTDLLSALWALNRLGYSVDLLEIDAAWFVPQSRRRLFVVGALGGAFRLRADSGESMLRPKGVRTFIDAHADVDWDLREVPDVVPRKTQLIEVVEELPDDDPRWWSRERAAYLLSQMSSLHGQIAQTMIVSPQVTVGAVFRRMRNGRSMAELRTDGLAGCLRTPKGGSAKQILFVAGRGHYRVRLFTTTECARLMGADDYPIGTSESQALFAFGDAVCVPVIDWLARNCLNPLVAELRGSKPQRGK